MNIRDYQERLKMHAPCEKGAEAFSRCKSRKDVFELLGGPMATDYFLKSIADGWGPTPEDMESVFRPYLNGGLTITTKTDERKIRSQVWCRADAVTVPYIVRRIVLIGCCGDIYVNDWQVVKIFVDANSSVRVHCKPNSIVYVESYGGGVNVAEGECKIKKHMQ